MPHFFRVPAPLDLPVLDPSTCEPSLIWLVIAMECDEVMLNRLGTEALTRTDIWLPLVGQPAGVFNGDLN